MNILCKIPGNFIVTGIPSHKQYTFSDEHKILPVGDESSEIPQIINPEDVTDLLSKEKKQGCCGNPVEIIKIFELID